ncbi:DUF4199 domain-containing protein [Mucilaginibacter sp.]|uniref:DUF4199 domain-containing protein n=1 Tax=Mucilaginibacter sp. TaxID=1882438 RepID=UPI00261B1E8C|nr:DUF4199 domain-containing protein [Mucilaginibacter sp.]MDB4918939.1 hypothetical protein [Mucilaginibacter sp.]
MENVKPSSTNLAFKWAIINVLTSIVITYAFQFLNIDQNSPARYLAFIPFIVFLLMAQKEYRDQLGGFLTYGEGFMGGFLFSIFAGLLGAIFIYVYLTFLSPQVFEQSLADAQTKMESKGLSSEQVDSAMAITKKYGTLFGAIGAVIGSIFIGAIIALIGAAIFKKERSILDIEQSSDNYTDPVV